MKILRRLVIFLGAMVLLAGSAMAQSWDDMPGAGAVPLDAIGSSPPLELRAEMGEVDAMVELGQSLAESSKEEALSWYLKAAALNDIDGLFYAGILTRERGRPGDHQKARDLLKQAASLCESDSRRTTCNSRGIWREIGSTEIQMALYRDALVSLARAEAMARAIESPDEALLALVAEDTGMVRYGLSLYQEALGNYAAAKAIYERLYGARSAAVANVLLNTGNALERLNQFEAALQADREALGIFTELQGADSLFAGYLHNNIGWTLARMEHFAESYSDFELALPIMRKHLGPESDKVVYTLTNMGIVREKQGRYAEAIKLNMRALVTATRLNDITLEPKRWTLQSLSKSYKGLRKNANAILFAKMAVNTQQQIRAQNVGLDEGQAKSLTEEWRGLYQELADLLIGEGRIAEAQYVLDLLKRQELIEFVRRDSSAATGTSSANLTKHEQKTFDGLDAAMQRPMALAVELDALTARQRGNSLTPEEEQRLAALSDALDKSYDAFLTEVDTLLQESSAEATHVQDEIKALNLEYAADRQEQLRSFARPTVLFQAASLGETLNLFLTTKDISVHRQVPVRRADLARLVFAALDAIKARDAAADVKLAELYDILIKPLEADLKASGAEVVMLNLGGFLRYLPFAALRSERGYLIEDYALALDTPAAQTKFETVSRDRAASAGFGVTEGHPGFSPLPGVATELETIFEGSDAKGELSGLTSLDTAFTEESFKDALKKRPQLLHVASHFRFVPGNETDSYLLLGSGAPLSLAKIRKGRGFRFGGVDLLTLSACETASGGGEGDEVESFGAVAQMNGASAVMATLWPIADGPTGQLMSDFYQGLIEGRLDKAQALRRAQLAMLKAIPASSVVLATRNASGIAEPEQAGPAPVTTRHPYYWSAFIIMGNWL